MKKGDLLTLQESLFVTAWSDHGSWVWCRGELGLFLGERSVDAIEVMVGSRTGWVNHRYVSVVHTAEEQSDS